MDINYIKQFLKDDDQVHQALKVKDMADLAEKTGRTFFSDFLDPALKMLLTPELQKGSFSFQFFGGYHYAERTVLALFPSWEEVEDWAFPFTLLSVKNNKFSKFSHRDVLGSILSLGIRREKLGDILFDDTSAYFFVKEDMKDYISLNLTKIKNGGVSVMECDFLTHDFTKEEGQELFVTMQSLRLDMIVSKGFHLSRNDSKSLVEQGRVKLNFIEENRPDMVVEAGDWISVKGYGRIQLHDIEGISKKGSYKIRLLCLK